MLHWNVIGKTITIEPEKLYERLKEHKYGKYNNSHSLHSYDAIIFCVLLWVNIRAFNAHHLILNVEHMNRILAFFCFRLLLLLLLLLSISLHFATHKKINSQNTTKWKTKWKHITRKHKRHDISYFFVVSADETSYRTFCVLVYTFFSPNARKHKRQIETPT